VSDNFWARKLGAPSSAPASAPFRKSNELYPLYTTPTVEQGAVPSQQMAVPQGQIPQEEYRPAVRLKQGELCPGCGSDKYFRPSPNYMPTCGSCGFNPRFEQSGYGERSLKTEPGQAKAAVQVAGGQTMQASLAVLQAGGGEHI
jgi:hypothetical protein